MFDALTVFDEAAQKQLLQEYWRDRKIQYLAASKSDPAAEGEWVSATVTIEPSISSKGVGIVRWGILASKGYYLPELEKLVADGRIRV